MKKEAPLIDFCKKCGSIMLPEKKRMKCRSCGYSIKKTTKELKLVEKKQTKKPVVVLEKDSIVLPITDKECEKCSNPRSYYWMQQTRSADEPPTQFFRCTKCKHVWREYK
ncbi:MAG: transcription factor S [Candidatus Aenigmarchaeota archaeon]|nr:transcription factor S [Candidatus Aenigmarchaeota archaeon]